MYLNEESGSYLLIEVEWRLSAHANYAITGSDNGLSCVIIIVN